MSSGINSSLEYRRTLGAYFSPLRASSNKPPAMPEVLNFLHLEFTGYFKKLWDILTIQHVLHNGRDIIFVWHAQPPIVRED